MIINSKHIITKVKFTGLLDMDSQSVVNNFTVDEIDCKKKWLQREAAGKRAI